MKFSLNHKRLCTLKVGPFLHGVGGVGVADHVEKNYHAFPIEYGDDSLTHSELTVRAPTFMRRFFRRQVMGDVGFHVPLIPLPARMAPLAFEMGLNLQVALTTFRMLILHSAVVDVAGKGAVLFPAASGSGKSTFAALMKWLGGEDVFSDEFGLIDLQTYEAISYPRPISLKNKSIDVIRETGAPVGVTFTGTPKGRIAYAPLQPTKRDRAPVKLIILPTFEAGAKTACVKIEPVDAATTLIESSTNYPTLGQAGFEAVKHLVETAPAYRLRYSDFNQAKEVLTDILSEGDA